MSLTSSVSTSHALSAVDGILASNNNDMDVFDILAAHRSIQSAMKTAMESPRSSSEAPPPYSQDKEHISFTNDTFPYPQEQDTYGLKRELTPYPAPPAHINFDNEALCHGSPRLPRLQRTLTPCPPPSPLTSTSKHQNGHHQIHIPYPHPHIHLHHPHTRLRAWINKEITAIRAVIKENQLKMLREWEERKAVDEEVRRLFLEDAAYWENGQQRVW